MVNQRTLENSFTLEGKGFYTGKNICITFNPAPENHGYKIRRVDLPGQPVINALAENVVSHELGNVLAENGADIRYTEHALAALYACEIDNCLIDVNASEFPILDGSSILFVSKIKSVGTQIQDAPRKYVLFKRKKIKVVDPETGSSMLLLPDDSFSIKSQISFDSLLLRKQDACLNDLSEFTKDFASARVFAFAHEVEPYLDDVQSIESDFDNAIIIYDKPIEQERFDILTEKMGIKRKDASKLGYIMNRPLSYINEPARHKVVDIIGDIALVGSFIKGKIIANCPNHIINNMFARAIREAMGIDVDTKPTLAKEMC